MWYLLTGLSPYLIPFWTVVEHVLLRSLSDLTDCVTYPHFAPLPIAPYVYCTVFPHRQVKAAADALAAERRAREKERHEAESRWAAERAALAAEAQQAQGATQQLQAAARAAAESHAEEHALWERRQHLAMCVTVAPRELRGALQIVPWFSHTLPSPAPCLSHTQCRARQLRGHAGRLPRAGHGRPGPRRRRAGRDEPQVRRTHAQVLLRHQLAPI